LDLGSYTIDLTAAGNPEVVKAYTAPLFNPGAAVVFASGFLSPTGNPAGGAAFGLFAALPDGTVIPLPEASLPTSVAEFIRLNSLSAYPNPASDRFNLNFDLAQSANVRVELVDIQGRLVNATDLGVLNAGTQQTAFDTAELAPGLYTYRVLVNENALTGKVAVTR
jgi:hypothetical protein